MCALFGSFDSQTLAKLAGLNSNRGFSSHSLCFLEPLTGKIIWQGNNIGFGSTWFYMAYTHVVG